MLDYLLIPIMLPEYPIEEEVQLNQPLEIAYSFKDRNPYMCIDLTNAYIDNQILTYQNSNRNNYLEIAVTKSATGASSENGVTADHRNTGISDGVKEPDSIENEAIVKNSGNDAATHNDGKSDKKLDGSGYRSVKDRFRRGSSSSSYRDNEVNSAVRNAIIEDEHRINDLKRERFIMSHKSENNLVAYNILNTCKIKAGIADSSRMKRTIDLHTSNPVVIANNYNYLRAALMDSSTDIADIDFLPSIKSGNKEYYKRIKPYIQLIELYKLIKVNNIKAVSLFDSIIRDSSFDSYSEKVKLAFWFQGFVIYKELNNDRIAYSFLSLVERGYGNKTQFSYTGSVIFYLLSDLAYKNKKLDYAEEYLGKYLQVIERLPEEKNNYIENLLKLSDIKIKRGNRSDALTILKKTDRILMNSDDFEPEKREEYMDKLAHLYIKIDEFQRALDVLQYGDNNFSFNSDDPSSIHKLLDLAVALSGSGQVNNAVQLMNTLNSYVDKLPVEERQIYYYTMSKLLMRQNRLQESYDNLLLAYDLFAKRDGFSNEAENLSNVSIIPTTSSLSPQYHPYMNRNEISLPVKGLTVVISGITLAFIICILTAMRYYNKSKDLSKEIDRIEDNSTQMISVNIKNYNDFINYIIRQSMNYHLSNDSTDNTTPYRNIEYINNKELYQIFVPAFTDLSIKRGDKQAIRQRNAFVERLQNELQYTTDVYMVNDYRYIIVKKPEVDIDAEDNGRMIIQIIESILKDLHLGTVVNIGSINYPFISSEPYSLESNRIFELTSLALAGARDISENGQKSSYIKFMAYRVDKNSIQDGATYVKAISCIRKGCIKVISVPKEENINWQDIQEDNLL